MNLVGSSTGTCLCNRLFLGGSLRFRVSSLGCVMRRLQYWVLWRLISSLIFGIWRYMRPLLFAVFDWNYCILYTDCIDPHLLDLGTSWRWVISFTPRLLYYRGKSPLYPLNRRRVESKYLSGQHEEEKIFGYAENRTLSLGRPARSQSVYRLRYPGSRKLHRGVTK
jgi:hypothetical protein